MVSPRIQNTVRICNQINLLFFTVLFLLNSLMPQYKSLTFLFLVFVSRSKSLPLSYFLFSVSEISASFASHIFQLTALLQFGSCSYRILTRYLRYNIWTHPCLRRTKGLAQVQHPSWRATLCLLSATAYSIFSQLLSVFKAVSSSIIWGSPMPLWRGTFRQG